MKANRKIFKNGLRVVTVPMKGSPTTTVLVMVKTGSEFETKDENGISHFLEHVCFKGTKSRPKSIDISHQIDAIGGQNNAFTSNEFTGYHAKANSKHTEHLLDVVSDIYLNSIFPEEEIQKEKGVIIEEMNMYEDLPQRKVHDVYSKLLHGNQSAGRTILGDPKVIKGATRETFLKYRNKHYVASATTIIVAGGFNEKKVLKSLEQKFKGISEKTKSKKDKVIERQTKPALSVLKKNTEQTHLVLGVRTFPVDDKRNTVLQVLTTLLGEGMSSRLFQKLREEMGVCYYVRTSHDEFTDHGDFSISAGVPLNRLEEVVQALLGEMNRLKNDLVPVKELDKAKEYLLGNLAMDLETSDSVAVFYGVQDALKLAKQKLENFSDIEQKVRKVSASDIKKLAQEIFVNSKLNLAVIGNISNQKRLEKILKF